MKKKVLKVEYQKRKFIDKAIKKHGNKYSYDKVIYINSITKVEVVCKLHGSFFVRPDAHVRKVGCPICNGGIKYTTDGFISKGNLVHNKYYDYSNVVYLNSNKKVSIICPIHGLFLMSPANHLNGQKCPSCSGVKKKTTDDFIIESIAVHGEKYDYSFVNYKNNRTKVEIICKEHGKFKQNPKDHLNGHGCKMCQLSKGEEKIEKLLKSLNLNFEREYRFKDDMIKKLPFDFYLPDLKLLIEYDGRQHYEPVEVFGGNGAFEKLKENDKIRNLWCENKNIELIRISYKDEEDGFNNLIKILNKKINMRETILNIVTSNKKNNISTDVIQSEYIKYSKSLKRDDYLLKSKFDVERYLSTKSELRNFLSDNYNDLIIEDYIINNFDFDFYLVNLKIGIKIISGFSDNELNVSKYRQQERSNIPGIKSIQIFDDIWVDKKPIVKSRILNLINKNKFRVFARNCEIVILSTKESSKFFNENHMQGNIGSSIKIGLKYRNEIVSAMTFGKRRKNLGSSPDMNSWELIRFANKKETSVIGSASRIFKYFLKIYNPNNVVSYADKCWSNESNIYEKINMKFVHGSSPSYFYLVGSNRKGRFGYRKDQLLLCGYSKSLTEHNICLNNLIFRIYDAGTIKYEWVKN